MLFSFVYFGRKTHAPFFLGCVHTWVPEHGARVRFLLGTNVNTPFFQVPTPQFWHGTRARVQGLDLVLGHCSGH